MLLFCPESDDSCMMQKAIICLFQQKNKKSEKTSKKALTISPDGSNISELSIEGAVGTKKI